MAIKLPFTHYHNCAGALGFLNIPLLIPGIKGSLTERVLISPFFPPQCLAKSWPGVLLSLLTLNLIVILSKLTLLKEQKAYCLLDTQDSSSRPSSYNHTRRCTTRLTFKLQRLKCFAVMLRRGK